MAQDASQTDIHLNFGYNENPTKYCAHLPIRSTYGTNWLVGMLLVARLDETKSFLIRK